MRSHIGWRGERNILYKGVKTSLYTRFKNLEGKLIRENGQYRLAVGLNLGCYCNLNVKQRGELT